MLSGSWTFTVFFDFFRGSRVIAAAQPLQPVSASAQLTSEKK